MALYFYTVSETMHMRTPHTMLSMSLRTGRWPQLGAPRCAMLMPMSDDALGKLTAAYEHGELMQEQYEAQVRAMYGSSFRRFVLDRNVDITGVSGTGIVAEGCEFSTGVCVVHWLGGWPSSVVWYERGLDAVLHVHGHDGRTVVRFLDGPTAGVPRAHGHDHEH